MVYLIYSFRSNSVTRQVTFNRTKIVEKAKIQKFRCDILSDFQTLCCPVGKIISKLDEFSFFIPFPFFFCCPFSLEILHHFIGD